MTTPAEYLTERNWAQLGGDVWLSPEQAKARGPLLPFDKAFAERPMDEATVNAAVDWLMDSGASLFDACVAFAAAPEPEKGWQWVLARFDRLTNGENRWTPDGKRLCDYVRAQSLPPGGPLIYYADMPIPEQCRILIDHVLNAFMPEINPRAVLKAAGLNIGGRA